VQAWLSALGVTLGIAAEGIVLGYVADFFLKRWHPERPGDLEE